MASEMTLVHVTHEAVGKIGGIGAVLQGFFTSKVYLEAVDRSILVGPLFSTDGDVTTRLGEHGEVIYSSVDGLVKTGYDEAFQKIEKFYGVGIVYGRRTFVDEHTGVRSTPEVLLIDVRHMKKKVMDEFKRRLFEEFGIQSHLYEHLWEYEQYVRLAPAAIAALKAIGQVKNQTTVISHEFMGMPTVLAALMDTTCEYRTAFYAHEVATMRRIVEKHPGHDTMFYNAMKRGRENRLHVSEVFGTQTSYFKHALIEASKHCDAICAVGDYVVDELRFLSPEFATADIHIVYNGIPAYQVDVAEKLRSKDRLQRYCETLLGYRPDFIFTHVTRLVHSKGLWRDIRILEHMEREFRTQDKSAVFLLLSTEVAQRPGSDICRMESAYKWPVAHREGMPDLSGGEANFYTAIQEFNARSRNIKIIFINQFGFSQKQCGQRMPKDMDFMDIRRGSDVEFGLSIYEPFGIAQLEPLTFGGLCVVSSVCGCAGFVNDVTRGEDVKNVIIADYTSLESHVFPDIEDLLQIGKGTRDEIEHSVSEKVAMQICSRLPKNDSEIEGMLDTGKNLAEHMSWEIVVKNYLLPTLERARSKQRRQFICSKAVG